MAPGGNELTPLCEECSYNCPVAGSSGFSSIMVLVTSPSLALRAKGHPTRFVRQRFKVQFFPVIKMNRCIKERKPTHSLNGGQPLLPFWGISAIFSYTSSWFSCLFSFTIM